MDSLAKRALKRLKAGRRTVLPIVLMDKYEVHPCGRVYERVLRGKGRILQRVVNTHIIEKCLAAASASQEEGHGV
jgi:hypothetical protein